MLTSLKESYDQPRQYSKKQRHYFVNKGPSSQGYGFSSGHIRMWELHYKESWAPKNWCFWTVVLEKTLESPLDCKENESVHPKGDQSWVFIGRKLMLKLKLQYFGHLMRRVDSFEKTLRLGKIEGRRRRRRQDEMVGWHHQLDGHGFGWTLGVGNGQRGLACCGSWSREESDTTERLSWTGIPSLPLALFVVMLPKAYLTSHSRTSDSRWVITPLWLTGSWRYFLYSSCILATSS